MANKLSVIVLHTVLCAGTTFVAQAQDIDSSTPLVKKYDWSVLGSYGYSSYYDFSGSNGSTPSGRIAVGKRVLTRYASDLGLEVGVQQNGRTHYSSDAGCSFTTYPMVDALLTLKTPIFSSDRIFANLKAGIAYTNWRYYRQGIDQGSQQGLSGEGQAGLGYVIKDVFNFSVLYQGLLRTSILSGMHTNLTNNLPAQNGVLLSLSMSL